MCTLIFVSVLLSTSAEMSTSAGTRRSRSARLPLSLWWGLQCVAVWCVAVSRI